jgi:hypothetical protein
MIVVADSAPLHYLVLLEQVDFLRSLDGQVLMPELRGRIFIHDGDDSGFTARRSGRAAPRRWRTA